MPASSRRRQAPASARRRTASRKGLQRAGYATDPAYADKLARVINTTLRLQRARPDVTASLRSLSIGSRAMSANYAALQTTGNNIANANTAGYSRQSVELATAFSQFSRRRLLRQGRRRRHRDARAQRLPDPRGGDHALDRRRPTRRASRAAAAARDGLPAPARPASATPRSSCSTPSSTSRTSRRTRRRARSCWPASATSRRAFAAPPAPARRAAGRHARRTCAVVGRVDQRADGAHRRAQPADRQRAGHRPRAERRCSTSATRRSPTSQDRRR